MQRYGDMFQTEVMFSTKCLEFLKIIPFSEISKQSHSKLKYAVCYTHFKYVWEALDIKKKKSQAECTKHWKKPQIIYVGFIEF